MFNINSKISAFSSFKSSPEREDICTFNINNFIKNKPFNMDFFIQETPYFGKTIKTNLNLDETCFYDVKENNFIDSWIELLEKTDSDYCLSVFDDFFFFGLDEKTIKSSIDLLDYDDTIDCVLIDHNILLSFDDKKNEIYLDKSYINDRNNNPNIIDKKIINDISFNIVNNTGSSFVYSWFMNTAIYRKEKYLESLRFFSAMFKNPHQAELNHHMCPEHLKLNKIATFTNSVCGMVDIGYVHIIGIRQPNTINQIFFEKLKQNYKIVI